MRVAAVSDVHAPQYLELFVRALDVMPDPDLLLLAGDMVLKGDHSQLGKVVEAIRAKYDGPIFAVFGNEEYDQYVQEFLEYEEIRWLQDESVVVNIGGLDIGIVGSRGSLDRPTFWQRTHVPGINTVYRERIHKIDRLLGALRSKIKIVITHYSPTYATLVGEREKSWSEMGSKKLERVIKQRQPDLWVHGHIHNGKKLEVQIGRTLVANVSLPARGGIFTVELPRKVGLEAFV